MKDEHQQAIAEAERAGFDLSLLQDALDATHTERAMQPDGALALVLELERIRDQRFAHTQPTSGLTG